MEINQENGVMLTCPKTELLFSNILNSFEVEQRYLSMRRGIEKRERETWRERVNKSSFMWESVTFICHQFP